MEVPRITINFSGKPLQVPGNCNAQGLVHRLLADELIAEGHPGDRIVIAGTRHVVLDDNEPVAGLRNITVHYIHDVAAQE